MLFVDTAYFKMVVYNNMLFFKLFTRSPHYSVDLSSLPQYHLSREKYNKNNRHKNQSNKQTDIHTKRDGGDSGADQGKGYHEGRIN